MNVSYPSDNFNSFISYFETNSKSTQHPECQQGTIQIHVRVEYAKDETTPELIPNLEAKIDRNGNIILADLLNSLKQEHSYLKNTIVSYFSPQHKAYVEAGRDHLLVGQTIPANDIVQMHDVRMITLRFRYLDRFEEKSIFEGTTMPEISLSDSEETIFNRKRHKPRKVKEVLELVKNWRALSKGIVDPITGCLERKTLDEAALIIGAAKKSLDDYHLIIKKANKLRYDFSSHLEENFGVVRTFVSKKKDSREKKIISDDESEDIEQIYENSLSCDSKKIKKNGKSSEKKNDPPVSVRRRLLKNAHNPKEINLNTNISELDDKIFDGDF